MPNNDLDPTENRLEMTAVAIGLGIVLSVVMGAANVYLGLKAGMTVSASIPAAVIAMGVLRGIFGRKSALESNLVQTAASAGESLAAGIIFTMPALILAGIWQDFDFWTTSLIALAGGLLGVVLMIPMRRVFVVDNDELKYPEGVACAEVLRVGAADDNNEASGLGIVIAGLAIGSIFKFVGTFLKYLNGVVEGARFSGSRVFYFGCDISPALLAVGYIVGFSISVQIFLGGAIGWLVGIPLLGTEGMELDSAQAAAWDLWEDKVRYVGVGAMLIGGVASIWKVRSGLLAAVNEMAALLSGKNTDKSSDPRDANISGAAIMVLISLCVLLIGWIYYGLLGAIAFTVLATVVMLFMSFFFAAVASYIVGLVGNSNSPVSGMTITAVLGTGLMIWLFDYGGEAGMIAMLGVAGVVCCVACTSGDVCNDLKTGHLVGASPRNQQIMQVIGVVSAAFILSPVMTVLHQGSINVAAAEGKIGGIGSADLAAPQASLFASLAKGFFGEETLEWNMIFWGLGVGVAILLIDLVLANKKSTFRLHVMPVAVGIYLPLSLSTPILLGGIVSWIVSVTVGARSDAALKRGTLLMSGLIAGESLVGVLLGGLAYWNITSFGSGYSGEYANQISVGALLAVAAVAYLISIRPDRKSDD